MKDDLFADVCIKYADVVSGEIDRAEAAYNLGMKSQSRVIVMALEGGECIRCGRKWQAVKVDNRYAHYTYYRPDCRCYPRCRKTIQLEDRRMVELGCGCILYEEMEIGQPVRCRNCGTEIGRK